MLNRITKLSKKEIAFIQIKAAADHYNKYDYISCITLAGAAEEILGAISKKISGFNQLENDISFAQGIYQHFTKQTPKIKEIIKERNKTKNQLKHNDDGEDLIIEADFENEACIFFVAAVKNYFDAFNELPNELE